MTPDLSDARRALVDILEVHEAIRPNIHRTPLLPSRSLSERSGAEVRLKCENLQRDGAFKVRGALAKVRSLGAVERARGVITYSSGNHAQGVAIAAAIAGVPAVVVMPEDAVASKRAATAGYGAEVILAGLTSDDRRAVAERLAAERGLAMVPPFDDAHIVCGQATVGVEALEDAPGAGAIFVPIGGGGLISGVAVAAAGLSPGTKVIGVEPVGAGKAHASLAAGARVRLERTTTIADGLRPLALGELTWSCIRRFVAEVVTVTDDEIREAVAFLLERTKLVVEPSGAASVAAAMVHARRFSAPSIAVLSGGNMDIAGAYRAAAGHPGV